MTTACATTTQSTPVPCKTPGKVRPCYLLTLALFLSLPGHCTALSQYVRDGSTPPVGTPLMDKAGLIRTCRFAWSRQGAPCNMLYLE
jgi:hypothetical protein